MKLGMIKNDCTEDAFRYVQGKGLDFIELCCNFPADSDRLFKAAAKMAKWIDKYDMPVLSCGRWNGDGGPLDAQGKVKTAYVKECKKLIDTCAKLGCPVFHCGVNRVEGMSLFRNYAAAIDYLRMLIEYAAPKGVQISTYNCHWNSFLDNMEAWEMVQGELPELGIKFDASHSVGAGRDYMEELRRWAHRFCHVHVKGALRVNGQYVDDPPAGIDMLNWPAILGMLYKAGFDKTLSIEPHSATWKDDLGERGLDYTIRYIRSLMV